MVTSSRPSRTEVLSVLDFNPETGVFVWRERTEHPWWARSWDLVRWNAKWAGQVAGTKHPQYGNLSIGIWRRQFKAHQLAWLVYYGDWPPMPIDHINGIPDDNRISNLRLADKSQNAANSKRPINNTSGYKGVSYNPRYKLPWRAFIYYKGKQIDLGRYASAEEGHIAYVHGSEKYFGAFARPV